MSGFLLVFLEWCKYIILSAYKAYSEAKHLYCCTVIIINSSCTCLRRVFFLLSQFVVSYIGSRAFSQCILFNFYTQCLDLDVSAQKTLRSITLQGTCFFMMCWIVVGYCRRNRVTIELILSFTSSGAALADEMRGQTKLFASLIVSHSNC